jgi:hypothetical protein
MIWTKQAISNREQQFWNSTQGKHSFEIVKNSTVQKKHFLDERIQPQGELKDKNFDRKLWEHTLLLKYNITNLLKIRYR